MLNTEYYKLPRFFIEMNIETILHAFDMTRIYIIGVLLLLLVLSGVPQFIAKWNRITIGYLAILSVCIVIGIGFALFGDDSLALIAAIFLAVPTLIGFVVAFDRSMSFVMKYFIVGIGIILFLLSSLGSMYIAKMQAEKILPYSIVEVTDRSLALTPGTYIVLAHTQEDYIVASLLKESTRKYTYEPSFTLLPKEKVFEYGITLTTKYAAVTPKDR